MQQTNTQTLKETTCLGTEYKERLYSVKPRAPIPGGGKSDCRWGIKVSLDEWGSGDRRAASWWPPWTLTSSNLQVALTRTMVPGRSTPLSCSRRHTRSVALLEGAHTRTRLSGKAWYTYIQGTGDKGRHVGPSADSRAHCGDPATWAHAHPPDTLRTHAHRAREKVWGSTLSKTQSRFWGLPHVC